MEDYYENYKKQLRLLLDRNRTLKYKYAIFKAVKPEDIVIDFGCGTGILGFFALQAGAQHVYAIEETSLIEYARKIAIQNKLEDKITFIHKSGIQITEQDIPEQVDVILSEPISNLLLEGNAWSTIEYLKKFLKPEGVILPTFGALLVVPVNAAPETFHDADVFIGGSNVYNIDFLDLPRTLLYISTLSQENWLARPQPLLEINLMRDKLSDNFRSSCKFEMQDSGQLVGLEFFFDVEIFENVMLSSKEPANYLSWAPLFAPAPFQPLISAGDQLRITVSSDMISTYRFNWTIDYELQSKFLPATDSWWKNKSAIPKLAQGVILSETGLIRLKKDDYFQYDCDNALEYEFTEMIPKALTCSEMCQIIEQSQKYNMTYDEIHANLVQLLHKLLKNALIQLPVPKERFLVTKVQSLIHIP
ncbi:MAG TPA: methyltransferase domain-containing protein [Candidatus Deferrimicrobium sp.]|nr:methyltransferase domain-containing protein [Candidatus Deferrimicrobium sp.]